MNTPREQVLIEIIRTIFAIHDSEVISDQNLWYGTKVYQAIEEAKNKVDELYLEDRRWLAMADAARAEGNASQEDVKAFLNKLSNAENSNAEAEKMAQEPVELPPLPVLVATLREHSLGNVPSFQMTDEQLQKWRDAGCPAIDLYALQAIEKNKGEV
jgi:hypothetical protein